MHRRSKSFAQTPDLSCRSLGLSRPGALWAAKDQMGMRSQVLRAMPPGEE